MAIKYLEYTSVYLNLFVGLGLIQNIGYYFFTASKNHLVLQLLVRIIFVTMPCSS